MARRNRETVVPQAEAAMDDFKYEVAAELGLLDKIKSVGWGEMTTREAGAIGGHMVRKMIEAAEESLVNDAGLNTQMADGEKQGNVTDRSRNRLPTVQSR